MASEGFNDKRDVEALRDALRDLRASSGLSQPRLAREVGTSQPSIARWVSPDSQRITVPTWEQLEKFLNACSADEVTATDIRRIRRDIDAARMPSRERVLSQSPQMQQRILELELAATRIDTFMPTVVPGSVQTEDYMRAVFSGAGIEGKKLEDSIDVRMGRRRLLGETGDRRWTLVMAEAALQWRISNAVVMANQCQYLADFDHPSFKVGVIQRNTTIGFPVDHGVELYANDESATVVVGTMVGTAILPDSDSRYSALRAQFDRTVAVATFGDAARDLFASYATEYRQGV